MKRDLTGKVIAITGASSGIGEATARLAAQAGMPVVLTARRRDRLDAIASEIQQAGGQAASVSCDVTRDDDVAQFIHTAEQAFGRLDVVFANAGYGLERTVMDTSDAEMRAIFEANFYGTLRTIQAAVPKLQQNPVPDRGHIVICSSSVSEVGLPRLAAYCATKAAQDSVAGALRAELHHEGIAVTSVHPVGTETEFFSRIAEDGGAEIAKRNTPSVLRQSAQHVARAILRALRRPRAEVWPSGPSRWLMAFATLCPNLAATLIRRSARRIGAIP